MSSILSDDAPRAVLPGHANALLVSVGQVVAVAIADLVTGYELTLSILYFVPLFIAGWWCGLRSALAIACFAVVAWMTSDVLAGHHYSHPFYRAWEGLIKLATWTMFALLLARLKTALERSDDRFLKVLEGLDALVYIVDLESGALLYSNPRCRGLLGDARGDAAALEGQWEHGAARAWSMKRLLDDLGRPNAGVTVEAQDRTGTRWYIVHARAMHWVDGRLVRLQVATDVTERRRAELEARRRQGEMEHATRLIMLGEMASTIAHELNQPLAAISNYNRIALRLLASGPADMTEIASAMEKSAAQAERAGTIIHRIRDLVRRREPQRTACSVERLAHDVLAMLEPDIARNRVQARVTIDPSLPAVAADAVLIEQALLNLCRNAIESMQDTAPAQRVLEISAHLDGGDRVRIEVGDTGCGVPDVVAGGQHRLFFTTRVQGTGIGLHVCRSVLEAHASRLVAAPRPTGGSVFSFTLPCWTGHGR